VVQKPKEEEVEGAEGVEGGDEEVLKQQLESSKPTAESLKEIERLERRIKSLKNWEKPNQIQPDAVILDDSLYLYGTDCMNTYEI